MLTRINICGMIGVEKGIGGERMKMKIKFNSQYLYLYEWGDFRMDSPEVEYQEIDDYEGEFYAVGEWNFYGVKFYPVKLTVRVSKPETLNEKTLVDGEWRWWFLNISDAEVVGIKNIEEVIKNKEKFEEARVWEKIQKYLEGVIE